MGVPCDWVKELCVPSDGHGSKLIDTDFNAGTVPAGAACRSLAPPPELNLTWPPLRPLLGVKSKKRVVLKLALQGSAEGFAELTLSTRAALTGMAATEAVGLFEEVARLSKGQPEGGNSKQSCAPWTLEAHEDLQLAHVSAFDTGTALEEQLASAVASAPHVLVVDAAVLSEELWHTFGSFKGAVLMVTGEQADPQVDRHLYALGITTRWCLARSKHVSSVASESAGCSLISEPLEVCLHNVEIARSGTVTCEGHSLPGLGTLVQEQLGPLYLDEFGADLGNLGTAQHDYGLKLSLLVEPKPVGETPELLGFLAYKPWAAPRPGVSVAAVGVSGEHRGRGLGRKMMDVATAEAAAAGGLCEAGGRVYLRSLPTAVPFYVRLGYTPVLETGTASDGVPELTSLEIAAPALYKDGAIDEDAPCVPMMSRAVSAGAHAQAEPWSPRRARHLEDGPTWLRRDALLAKVAGAGA
mmetsp:Transcript_107153/g.303010  ORF Transcript_107153/g.303010 Transcript_107153/m.303010 type:complete len:469 (+) Transcript_107153:57-1463(+)